MTQPDYLKARELVEAWQRNPGIAGEPDLQTRIAQALHDAHLAGRREGSADGYRRGIEEAAKVADDAAHYRREHKRKGPAKGSLYSCDVDREIDALAIAGNIRALLRGGKDG